MKYCSLGQAENITFARLSRVFRRVVRLFRGSGDSQLALHEAETSRPRTGERASGITYEKTEDPWPSGSTEAKRRKMSDADVMVKVRRRPGRTQRDTVAICMEVTGGRCVPGTPDCRLATGPPALCVTVATISSLHDGKKNI